MFDRSMTRVRLAKETGILYQTLCSVMTGYIYNEDMARKICQHLGVEY
jgi:DNA-binding XRE family transcriptional regulator